MSAEILPFPLVRRQSFVQRTADRVAMASTTAAEKLLQVALQQQADAFGRKGISPDRIACEIRQLENAIRCAMWKRLLRPPGGAA